MAKYFVYKLPIELWAGVCQRNFGPALRLPSGSVSAAVAASLSIRRTCQVDFWGFFLSRDGVTGKHFAFVLY